MNEQVYREAYNDGKELVPDYVYDTMGLDELDDTIGQGDLVPHKYPMLSLPTHIIDIDNISLEQLKVLGLRPIINPNHQYEISYKVDGIAFSVQFENGAAKRLLTRGKRHAGYTINAAFMQLLPENLKTTGDQFTAMPIDNSVELRGEILMSNADFEDLNIRLFNSRYAKPRSLVAALVSNFNPNLEAVSKCKLLFHGWQNRMSNHLTHCQMLGNLIDFKHIVPNERCGEEDLIDAIRQAYRDSQDYEFPCDGIVVQHSLSTTSDGRAHLDRLAIKQHDEAKYSAQTEVTFIEWRLANNGSYFPRIHFAPVDIDGSEVEHASGYSYDYINRMGLTKGAKVILTMHGAIIPYVSKVLQIGNGDFCFPGDIELPEPGDMHIWSTNSEDAIQRIRFIRGMSMLQLDTLGGESFSKMYDGGFKDLFDVAKAVRAGNLLQLLHQVGFPATDNTRKQAEIIKFRFETFNYVWLLHALRIPGIGFDKANLIGLHLSGYHLLPEHIQKLNYKHCKPILGNAELLENVKTYSNKVLLEHAQGTIEYNAANSTKIAENAGKLKCCLSKKPDNGQTKHNFFEMYLADKYVETQNIKEANLLVCPAGEQSNKINYAMANGIEIKNYSDFL